MNKETTIKVANLHCKSKVIAYEGWHVKYTPVETIMKNGEVVQILIGHVAKPAK
jgi:dihydroorotase-like cyclic amidohydrolase